MNDRGIENLYLGREKRDREKRERRAEWANAYVCLYAREKEKERSG